MTGDPTGAACKIAQDALREVGRDPEEIGILHIGGDLEVLTTREHLIGDPEIHRALSLAWMAVDPDELVKCSLCWGTMTEPCTPARDVVLGATCEGTSV